MSAEAYCRVIDIIASGRAIDWQAIGIEIAKANPEAFIALVDGVKDSSGRKAKMSRKAFNDVIDEYMRIGAKVEAIKYARTHAGISLKEAKDYVERQHEFGDASLPASAVLHYMAEEKKPTIAPDALKLLLTAPGDAPISKSDETWS